MERGTVIDYSLQLNGIRFRWRTEISVWDPPELFVDRQVRGPYRHWEHRHLFEADEGDGTRAQDIVEYAVPGGIFEPLIHRWFVRRRLDMIFEYRRSKMTEIFALRSRKSD